MNSLKELLEQIDAANYNQAGLELLGLWRRQIKLRTEIENYVDDKSESLEEVEGKDTPSEFGSGLYFSHDRWVKEFDKESLTIFERIIELFGLQELYESHSGSIHTTFSRYAVDDIDFDGLIADLKTTARIHFIPALKN